MATATMYIVALESIHNVVGVFGGSIGIFGHALYFLFYQNNMNVIDFIFLCDDHNLIHLGTSIMTLTTSIEASLGSTFLPCI